MTFFRLPGRSGLKQAWEFTTDDLIWRLVPAGPSRAVGEERNLERKSVAFFYIDLASGKPLWRNASFGQQWWSGIEAIGNGVMLLHGFATPELPEHRGITAVNLVRGEVAWSRPDLQFNGLRDTAVLATMNGAVESKVVVLDLQSGQVIDEGLPAERAIGHQKADISVRVPLPVIQGTPSARIVESSRLFRPAVAPVEVLETGSFLVAVWYESAGSGAISGKAITSLLGVIDLRTGRKAFGDTLHRGAASIVPEVVFVQDHNLYYIKNRRTLAAVHLPQDLER